DSSERSRPVAGMSKTRSPSTSMSERLASSGMSTSFSMYPTHLSCSLHPERRRC
ncbi:hypothetical protein MPH_14238, partial [Macrophomina phaseolina MS6]